MHVMLNMSKLLDNNSLYQTPRSHKNNLKNLKRYRGTKFNTEAFLRSTIRFRSQTRGNGKNSQDKSHYQLELGT